MADRRGGAVVLLVALAAALPAARAGADTPAKGEKPRPTFDVQAPSPHHVEMTIDLEPARDMLILISGKPEAPAALKRLKASATVSRILKKEGLAAGDFFGRLASAAAGTPDPLLSTFSLRAEPLGRVLDGFDSGAAALADLAARRVASLLPAAPAVSARFVLVPFLGVSGFSDVTSVAAVPDDESILLVADVARMTDDPLAAPTTRETVLKVLRAASAEAWQVLFDANFKKGPAWIEEKTPGFETLLARTAAEGPATLFLFPDEFFPLSALLDEPISRAFNRWNRAVERLQDPKLKESEKGDVVSDLSRGDFWNRSTAIVGAQIVDALVRTVGRDEYLRALAAGPRSVATLYLQASKGTKLPAFGKAAKKFLEARPPGS